ncbi:hypothetical protein VTG60DRAFT_6229 [Thermothelomyces hinnuleus]
MRPESAPIPGLDNTTYLVAVAAVVGGGTVVNGMAYGRGSKADYDAWEELGNPGWGWDGMLPYFVKSTTFTPPSPEVVRDWNVTWNPAVYGRDGAASHPHPRLPVSRPGRLLGRHQAPPPAQHRPSPRCQRRGRRRGLLGAAERRRPHHDARHRPVSLLRSGQQDPPKPAPRHRPHRHRDPLLPRQAAESQGRPHRPALRRQ